MTALVVAPLLRLSSPAKAQATPPHPQVLPGTTIWLRPDGNDTSAHDEEWDIVAPGGAVVATASQPAGCSVNFVGGGLIHSFAISVPANAPLAPGYEVRSPLYFTIFDMAPLPAPDGSPAPLLPSSFSPRCSAFFDVVSQITTPPPPPPPPPPAAPTNLVATAVSSSEIDLTWTDNSNNEDGFIIQCEVAPNVWQSVCTVAANVTTCALTGLTASTLYTYRVAAYRLAQVNNSYSAFSNTASATTLDATTAPPDAPTGLVATSVWSSQVSLSWTDNSGNESGFLVERAGSASGPFVLVATLDADTTTYDDGGLTPLTTYFYRVCATNSLGNSDYTNVAGAATYEAAPSAIYGPAGQPIICLAVASSETSINVYWSPTLGASLYNIYRRDAAGGTPFVADTVYAADTDPPAPLCER